MILLDTHVLLWLGASESRLGPAARRRIHEEIDAGTAFLSAISLWEIAMLDRKRRITLSMPLAAWVARIAGSEGLYVVPVDAAIATDAGSLPDMVHGDPCDRLILATARIRQCPLLTADRALLACGKAGHVESIDALL